MNDAYHSEEYKGFTIKLINDSNTESPREWDNLGVIAYSHRDYTLGDKNLRDYYDLDNFNSWEEIKAQLVKDENIAVILPLYLYDHSGLFLKIGSWYGLLPQGHAEFDSGQVGFVYVTKEAIRKEYGVKRITRKTLEKAEKVIRSEAETFAKYISGDVRGFVVEDADGEHLDSCWGYYEDEDAISEAKSIIDGEVKTRQEAHEAKLKAYITNSVPINARWSI